MRACVMRQGRLETVEVDAPRPEVGQLLVRTLVCGICGTDLHFLRHAQSITRLNDELLPTMGASPLGQSHVDPSRDVYMGHEFCGEVLELGPDTPGPPPGTRVVSVPVLLAGTQVDRLVYSNEHPCGFAERMLLSSALCIPVPSDVDSHHASLTEPIAVGMHAVAKACMQPGDGALVIGCGPVGLAVIASLKLAGVGVIVASDFSPRRRELAIGMGATHAVDASIEPAIEGWRRAAGDRSAVIFEAVGAPGMIQDILTQAPVGARLVVVGMCMEPDSIVPYFGIAKELSVQFVVAYSLDEFASAFSAIANGTIDVTPMITDVVGLDAMPEAFDSLRHADEHCKILVEPGPID